MAYVIPQVEVFQDFETSPSAAANALQAHISGPHAQLIRYSQPDEQPLGELGLYDPLDNTAYAWPNLEVGALIDPTYVQLWAQNAILPYYTGDNGTSTGVTTVSGASNRVRSSGTAFKTNGTYVRSGSLYDRDVAIGDVVKLRFVPESGEPTIFWSYVNGFVGDVIASSHGTPTLDASNAATASATTSFQQTQGPWNAVEIASASAASYDPYPTGQTTETYTLIVTSPSSHGDFTTATLKVVSASGLDDQAAVTPSARGSATAIGAHGLTVTFNIVSGGDGTTDSESAMDQGVSPDDLLLGQRFIVTASAAHTATPVPTAGGTYTGLASTTYVVTVTTGNKFSNGAARVTVTTTTGVDVSGPTSVAAAATAIPIGNFGLTLSFAGAGLALGDRFYVAATAAGVSQLKTLVLGNTIPSSIASGVNADITLYIRNPNLQISIDRTGEAPLVNYSVTDSEITVNSGMIAFDPTWTDGGVPMPIALDSDAGNGYTTLFVQYRAWNQILCNNIGAVNDPASLDSVISGPLDPDNPLKWGVFKALTNSNGTDVLFTSVCSPDDLDSWANVLGQLLGVEDAYGLVPLTNNPAVWELFVAHVNDQSSPEQGFWRALWISLTGLPTIPVVSAGSTVPGYTAATTADGDPALATIAYNPSAPGTQYTLLTVTSGNADFITNGVRAGDVVYAGFATDGFGASTYSQYVVSQVITQEQLILVSGPGSPVSVASKIEVWRNLNATDEATAISRVAGAFSNSRVRAIWPDTIDTAGVTQAGYHLCAALAGLRAGIMPHQGMTNLAISGFDSVPRTTKKFNQTQLNLMAGNGVWIVTQTSTGEIISRQAITTAPYININAREEMVVSNVDSISFRFKDTFGPYIGIANVTPTFLALLNTDIRSLISVLTSENSTTNLGPQLIDGEIVDLRQHLTLADRIVLILNLTIPYPLNTFEVHLVVPAYTGTTATATGVTTVPTTPTTTG